MDINELRDLTTKLVYQDTLDLNEVGVRDLLQDLVGDEVCRLRERENNEWRIYQLHRPITRPCRER